MTGTLRILQTCFSRSWGGLEIQALEVSANLSQRGHRVSLLCCRESRLADEARARQLDVCAFDVTGYLHPLILWRLSRLIAGEKPEIIHCQHSRDLATVVPAADLAGGHAKILLSKRVGSYLSKRDVLHRYTYSRLSRVLAISEVIHRNVLETTPMGADRVVTLHDAIDTELFSPKQAHPGKVRAEFGYTEEHLLVGFVGRFSPGKGHEEFLEAASLVAVERPEARFLIVGEASAGEEAYESEIRRRAGALGLDRLVTFAGFRTDIPDVMAAFDIFAFPSHAESFGVALIEAMAMERPVVSTNCDGVLDIVTEGETGLFVHPGSAQELARAIGRLAGDPSLRVRLGRAGRARVLALFDRRAQMEALERIYRGALAE